MANVKISGLPLAGAITGSELVPVAQNSGTKQTTVTAITAAAANAAAAASAAAASKVASVAASSPLASSGGTTPTISLNGTVPVANGGTGETSYTNGQLLIGNSTGNTLTKATLTAGSGVTITNGAGSITIAAVGLPVMNVVTGTTQAAAAGNHYVITNVALTTVTLPSTPAAGDVVWVTVANGLTTNIIARNGQNIMGLAEDMTLNAPYASAQLRFVNASLGWRLV